MFCLTWAVQWMMTENSYKSSHQEWKFPCGVVRLWISKASYSYRSNHPQSLTNFFFFRSKREKEKIDAHKPSGPYPRQCHLVLVWVLIHAVALCLKEIREIWHQLDKANNPRKRTTMKKPHDGQKSQNEKPNTLSKYALVTECKRWRNENCNYKLKSDLEINYKGGLTAGVEHPCLLLQVQALPN